MSDVTVKELDALVDNMASQREVIDAIQERLTEANKKLMDMESQFVTALKEHGRTNYTSPVGTFSLIEKWNYKSPESPEAKAEFFEFLRGKGVFEQYATVNYNSLNAFCRAESEAAAARGEGLGFKIPGISEPKISETIRFVRSKK